MKVDAGHTSAKVNGSKKLKEIQKSYQKLKMIGPVRLRPYPVNLWLTYNTKIDGSSTAQTILKTNNNIEVQFEDNLPPIELVVHEAVHVTQFVGQIIDEDLDGEAEAYLTQDIVTTMLDKQAKR